MSNKETLQEYNTKLDNNNTSLDSVLEAINELPSSEMFATNEYVDEQLSTKQPLLTAGENITIVDNVISATGGGNNSESLLGIPCFMYTASEVFGGVYRVDIGQADDIVRDIQYCYDNNIDLFEIQLVFSSTVSSTYNSFNKISYIFTIENGSLTLTNNREILYKMSLSSKAIMPYDIQKNHNITITDGVVGYTGDFLWGYMVTMTTLATTENLSLYANKSTVLTKTNTSAFTPTADYHPSTKKYVDDAISAAITTALEGEY